MMKILFLAANPSDTTRLRLSEEVRAIDQALRGAMFRDQFDLQQQPAVRVGDLGGLLLRHQPHIVHFSGHGSAAGEIILEDDTGNAQPVSSTSLSQLFLILRDNIRCVVLNACYSAQQAQAIAQHIDCVIGMSQAISDVAAISFAANFYQALGYGRDVQTAFELGCTQIALESLREEDKPQLLANRKSAAEIRFVSNEERSVQPDTHPRSSDSARLAKRTLRETMIKAFSLEELELLCVDVEELLAAQGVELQVNLEIVGGSSKSAKVLNLIEYLDRRSYLDYLVAAVRQARSDII